MTSRLKTIALDARDPAALAPFWSAVLGWPAGEVEDDGEVALRAPDGTGPYLLLLPVPESKTIKNRMHLDLDTDDQDAEVDRLLGLGATRVDIGQGEQTWVVLADPEGNEFCILRPRAD
jgi:predicted enzyme related to lactoylglutathione lyase